MNGAMALLDFRGEEQLLRPISLQLISALRTQVASIGYEPPLARPTNPVIDRKLSSTPDSST